MNRTVDKKGLLTCCFILFLSILAYLFSGCASLPKESVLLSQVIGQAITNNHSAYVNLVNKFFDERRSQVDEKIENTYLPAYIKNVREAAKAQGADPNAFPPDVVVKITQDVSKRRDEAQRDLEKTRVMLLDRINQDHITLVEANASLTALLQSAVKVREETSSLVMAAQKPLGTQVSLDEIDKKFADYLLKLGDITAKGTSLYDEVNSIIKRKGE